MISLDPDTVERNPEILGNVTKAHDGLALNTPPFALAARTTEPEILVGPRIGLTKGVETPWRFGLKGSKHLSKPFPR